MEVVGAVASIYTLLEAGKPIAGLCRKIKSLNDAPAVLMALNNEVSDLELLISEVKEILNSQPTVLPGSFNASLGKLKASLLQLDHFIAYDITIPTTNSSAIRIDKSAFLKLASRIPPLQEKIRWQRLELLSILSPIAAFQGLWKHTSLQCSIDEISRQLTRLASQIHNQSINSNIKQLELPSINPSQDESEQSPNQSGVTTSAVTKASSNVENRMTSVQRTDPSITEPRVSSQSSNFQIHIERATDICDSCCPCSCHLSSALHSPNGLTSVLGYLSIGYTGIRRFGQTCNHYACKKSTGSSRVIVTYIFPYWLLRRAIACTFQDHRCKGPELCIKVMLIRPMSCIMLPFLVAIRRPVRCLKMLKALLVKGQASLRDIAPQGDSYLQIAIEMSQWDVVRFLISEGADRFSQSENQSTPSSRVWEKTWTGRNIPADIRQKFWDSSQFECYQFPEVHRAYLGISNIPFDRIRPEISNDFSNCTDQNGRTLLSWATQRGDSHTVLELLKRGADPNLASYGDKFAPLHYCFSLECIRLLLEHGADVNVEDLYGNTPLQHVVNVVSSGIAAESRYLIENGADIESRNHKGWTPLMSAALRDDISLVIELLKLGANINARNNNGGNILMVSMSLNRHTMLKYILRQPNIDLSVLVSADGQTEVTVLEVAAYFADVRSLKILQRFRSKLVDIYLLVADHISVARRYRFSEGYEDYPSKEVNREEWNMEWATLIDMLKEESMKKYPELYAESDEWTTTDGSGLAEESSDCTEVSDSDWEDAPESPA